MLPSAEQYSLFFCVWFLRSTSAKTKHMNKKTEHAAARRALLDFFGVPFSARSAENGTQMIESTMLPQAEAGSTRATA
jgi:hypothetical protein